MNHFQKFISVLLILILSLSVFSACGKQKADGATEDTSAQLQETVEAQASTEPVESVSYYQIGDKIEDFTITTYDGREVSLYKVLEEKDMVLLNLWATWCGPCGMEFPVMQEVYEQYQDKVEIIAISVEPTDTDEILTEYAQEKGMTFCVAKDSVGIGARFFYEGIPTSIVVDRFGTICLIDEGAMTDTEIFTHLFDIYTGEDYTQSVFMPSMLSELPTAAPSEPKQLYDALNGEGNALEFANASNPYYWPMTVVRKDGRDVVAASNASSSYSKSVLEAQVQVNAGDVLILEYKMETADFRDTMTVEVDGKRVKKTINSRDWGTYAYQFPESGSHQIQICFDTDWQERSSNDGLWIDSIRIVSGDEALQALEANHPYPVGEEIQMQLVNENVQIVYVCDENEPSVEMAVHICPDPTLQFLVTLDETVDPENSYLEDMRTLDTIPLASHAVDGGFLVEIPNANPYAQEFMAGAALYCDGNMVTAMEVSPSRDYLNLYFDMLREEYGLSFLWCSPKDPAEEAPATGDVTYTVTYIDQNGDPVPGVMCQVCDETMCQVFTSDDNGICQFTLPAKNYEIHTLMVPAGYEGDTTTITNAPVQGGALTFTLTKK